MPAAARPSPEQALRDGLQQDTGLLLSWEGTGGIVHSENRGETVVVMVIARDLSEQSAIQDKLER